MRFLIRHVKLEESFADEVCGWYCKNGKNGFAEAHRSRALYS